MKKQRKGLRDVLIALAVMAALIIIAAVVVWFIISTSNVAPSMADVMDTIQNCIPQIVMIVVFLVLMLVVIGISGNMSGVHKLLLRGEGMIVSVIGIVVAANLLVYGPLNTLISVNFSDSYALSDRTYQEGRELNEKIVGEGIVLLKNTDNFLPMEDVQNLNVFGWGSTNPVYGGSGSGAGTANERVSLIEGLENAGFSTNSELTDFYTEYCEERPLGSGVGEGDFTLPEPSRKQYSEELLQNAKDFSDVALVVICRQSGEGCDMPNDMGDVLEGTYPIEKGYATYNTEEYGHEDDFTSGMSYLELSNTERDLIDMVCSEFSNVIVLVNSANAMELGFLEEYDQIKGALLAAGVGDNGFDALGSILRGDVNPSGKTADTYVYDLLASPYINNVGNFTYNNIDDLLYDGADQTGNLNSSMNFVNYVEGIYVGYKFYETAAYEGLLDYDEAVQYPLGYGLSYTTFSQEITEMQDNGGEVTVRVEVTNTGDVAGKDVVQLYYTPPYYNGGIEKASVNLLNFAKTDVLEPGESATVELTFTYDDLASYDTYNYGCYVTEHGNYNISIRSDSHTPIASETINIAEDIIYNEENDGARESDAQAASNVFQYAEGDVVYLSRADQFANYEEATAAPSEDAYSLSQEQKDSLINLQTWKAEDNDDPDDQYPTMEADNGLTFYDMKGIAYDDEKWDALLDQMSFDEMATLVGMGGYGTAKVESIDLPSTLQSDGPTGLNGGFGSSNGSGTTFCSLTLLASTWNKDLAYERGCMIGKQADELHFSGWYGPGANTHRTAFGGRNFEYYSEDSVLAGYMCAGDIKGARDNGLIAYMKHFALNDQETNRANSLMTWSNEQAIREIYLRAFEIGAKEGNAMGVMSSFNFIGNKWAGGSGELLQTVLRDEWGFEGVVVTDWYIGDNSGFMDSNLATRNGGDQMLSTTGTGGAMVTDDNATAVIALRESCHNIIYALSQSNVIDWEVGEAGWSLMVKGIDIGIAVLVVAAEIIIIVMGKRLKTTKKSE